MARAPWKHRMWWHHYLPWYKATRCNGLRHGLYPEYHFRQKLVQERRRAERSNKPLLVAMVHAGQLAGSDQDASITCTMGKGVHTCVRETDICGVLQGGAAIGVILTEIEADKLASAKRTVTRKIREKLDLLLDKEEAGKITISFRIYPEAGGEPGAFDMIFFPEVTSENRRRGAALIIKRAMDVVGSLAALVVLSPVFLFLPLVIKVGSKGPVFFRQERVGRNGRKFKLLKFRTMFVDNDDGLHRDFVKNLIEGKVGADQAGAAVFKITGDPRVTGVGRVLRKYSLDELPQFLNVLQGDMSLVGPRPPICYELQHYSGWQRNRLIGGKPGITGVWQVSGRSSTSFDDMVRLDLRYLKGWSVRLDVKIMLQTPMAVLRGKGAY